MSWDRTYTHTLAIAIDQFAAAVFFNRPDLTISSLCRLVQLADLGVKGFPERLTSLKFSVWQTGFLRRLASILDRIQKRHCELARVGDLDRADSTRELLALVPLSPPQPAAK